MKPLFPSIALTGFAAAMLAAGACADDKQDGPPAPIQVEGLSLNDTRVALMLDDSVTLVASVQPENATDKSVAWATSAPSVAAVNGAGRVLGLAEGEAVITASTTDGGKTATCTVTVVERCLCEAQEAPPTNTPLVEINTNKALYAPGETVTFTLAEAVSGGNIVVRYRHLATLLSEQAFASPTWTWTPPAEDYKGYMVELVDKSIGEGRVLGTVGVDVSSDWKKFPRYGFLSKFGNIGQAEVSRIIANLNRYHINGLQYYDWLYKHHKPLAGAREDPMAEWPDIARRPTFRSTTEQYIAAAKSYGMKSMMYNLCYGAWNDAADNGVQEQWYIFKDNHRGEKDNHPLPFWLSDIFLVNPALPDWQAYMAQQNDDVYHVYDFDGYHIDQLGSRSGTYGYDGAPVNLTGGFLPFITAMKTAHPHKRLVMNVVSGNGRAQIAQGDVDFCYEEVWDNSYSNLRASSTAQKPTVYACYMNYDYPGKGGTHFNTPGVLFADAVIFAHGGAHIELGEHMLCSEYYPNSSLTMTAELEKALLSYYDFLVAYENLLRDGQTSNTVNLSCRNEKMAISNSISRNKVTAWGKVVGSRQLVHLVNFATCPADQINDARDREGLRPEPEVIAGACLRLDVAGEVDKVWVATPDLHGGAAESIPFCPSGGGITFTLPYLKYWSMVVVEYK